MQLLEHCLKIINTTPAMYDATALTMIESTIKGL